MIARKIAARGRPRTGPESRPPKRNRAWLFFFLTLGAGAVSGILALVGPAVVTDVGAAITTHVAPTAERRAALRQGLAARPGSSRRRRIAFAQQLAEGRIELDQHQPRRIDPLRDQRVGDRPGAGA